MQADTSHTHADLSTGVKHANMVAPDIHLALIAASSASLVEHSTNGK